MSCFQDTASGAKNPESEVVMTSSSPLLWDTKHSQVVMASSIFLSYRKAVALLVKMGYFVQFLCPFCIDTIPGL